MQTINEVVGDEVKKQPDGLFDKIKDFAIFAGLMPLCNSILFMGQYVVSAAAIIWAAINNQNIFSILWLVVAFVVLYLVGYNSLNSLGLFSCKHVFNFIYVKT